MKNITAIIIDDEQNARSLLRQMLEAYCPDVEILGEAQDVPSAVKIINTSKPSLVFLDIEMPIYSGFELFNFFEENQFQVIFITAYAEFAIRAFEVSSTDYLLKPINASKLKKAIEKAKLRENKQFNKNSNHVLMSAITGDFSKVCLPIADGFVIVHLKEIVFIKAEEKYCYVHLIDKKKILVNKSLKELEAMLSPDFFFKTNRSYIINVAEVKQFVKREGGVIEMSSGAEVSISKERRDDFLKKVMGSSLH